MSRVAGEKDNFAGVFDSRVLFQQLDSLGMEKVISKIQGDFFNWPPPKNHKSKKKLEYPDLPILTGPPFLLLLKITPIVGQAQLSSSVHIPQGSCEHVGVQNGNFSPQVCFQGIQVGGTGSVDLRPDEVCSY